MGSFRKFSALERQREIFTNGLSGLKPKIPIGYDKLVEKARRVMDKKSFAYLAGGAGTETTMADNRAGFEKWKIIPRMLRDVSACNTHLNLFGQQLATPLLLAPIGVLELAHRQADVAVAMAAAKLDIPMIFSNQASVSMERCAAVMQNNIRWFQLYWSKSSELVLSLVKRAENCGCKAIVVTLDTTMLGWRPRDLESAHLPFLAGKGLAQYTSDPVFQRIVDNPEEDQIMENKPSSLNLTTLFSILRLMKRFPGSTLGNFRSKKPLAAVRTFINLYTNPALKWSDLQFLRKNTKLPILLKGILHPDDARQAIDHGMDGIIVSNHGGRQLDGAISSIEALPAIVNTVEGRLPVLFDSGIRTGADVFKALALGATAVCIGRPYAYGLALGGQNGVEAVLKNLLADFELAMRLAGCRSVAEIKRNTIIKINHAGRSKF